MKKINSKYIAKINKIDNLPPSLISKQKRKFEKIKREDIITDT